MAKNESGKANIVPANNAEATGTGVVAPGAFANPGLPPHRPRVTDLDPKAAKRAERVVYSLFYLSIAASVFAVYAYMFFPIEPENVHSVRMNTLYLGLGIAFSLLAIGIAAVHWGKALMADKEAIDHRHPVRGTEETRARAVEIFRESDEESGFSRRTLIRNGLIGALIAFPLPAIALFRGLAPMDVDPNNELKTLSGRRACDLLATPREHQSRLQSSPLVLHFRSFLKVWLICQNTKSLTLKQRQLFFWFASRRKTSTGPVRNEKAGLTRELSRTQRFVLTLVALLHFTNSRHTTCFALATSHSLIFRTSVL